MSGVIALSQVPVSICSLLGGITIMCVKGVSTGLVLSLQGDNQLMKPIFWAFLLAMFFTLICQIRYLNKAMASFGVSEVCLCFAQCRPPIHRQSSDAGGRA